MFIDACAIIAVLSDEPEADRVSEALVSAEHRITSPVAVTRQMSFIGRAAPAPMLSSMSPPMVQITAANCWTFSTPSARLS